MSERFTMGGMLTKSCTTVSGIVTAKKDMKMSPNSRSLHIVAMNSHAARTLPGPALGAERDAARAGPVVSRTCGGEKVDLPGHEALA